MVYGSVSEQEHTCFMEVSDFHVYGIFHLPVLAFHQKINMPHINMYM